jgi:transporter family protein
LFIKKASASIDPILGGVLLQIVAAVLGAGLLAVQTLVASKPEAKPLALTKQGVSWAIAAGVAVGVAEILSFIISSMGVPASRSIPTIVGGSVLLGTLLGAVWLGEQMATKGWCGIVLIALGIALVGMDPGSSLH